MMLPVILHNLKISLRVLARNKLYTAINLTGLVLGLTASFVLLIFAINELSYNRCFIKADRIYRVISVDKSGIQAALGPCLLKKSLTQHFPSIESAARIINLDIAGGMMVKGETKYREVTGFCCVDPELINIMQIRVIRGTTSRILSKPWHVIISEKAAGQYFKSQSPIGKTLFVSIQGMVYRLVVSGVFSDLPWNSTFRTDFIAGFGFYREVLPQFSADPDGDIASINDYSAETFLLLKENAEINDIIRQLPVFYRQIKLTQSNLILQNFKGAYLNSDAIQDDLIAKGSKDNLYIYLSLSLFILILASINYAILSIARAALRFKEIGVRKVLGATRGNLRVQLLTESVILTVLAFPLSFLLIGLINPVIEHYFGYKVHFDSAYLLVFLVISCTIPILIGLMSGLYVAMYLSKLDPVTALKSSYVIYKKVSLSKIFIVFQVFITLGLFIGLINIFLQIRLCLTRQQGISQENLLVASFNSDNANLYRLLHDEVKNSGFATSITGSSTQIPTNGSHKVYIGVEGYKKKVKFEFYMVDDQFIKTLGATIIAGKDFIPGDTANRQSVIINEEAASLLGYFTKGTRRIDKFKIRGVTRDINIHTMHWKIGPMVFQYQPGSCKTLIIKCKAGEEQPLLDVIDKKWESIAPDVTLNYNFYDQEMNMMYIKEQNFGHVVGSFTMLAFIITGMGLFGLAMLIVERRMKEMSIRKVFGASGISIIYLIQKEFLLYILIAALLAIPVAWYGLSLWLERFYYRIGIHWYVFLLSVAGVGLFVSMILLIKTLRVLNTNPASALKYE